MNSIQKLILEQKRMELQFQLSLKDWLPSWLPVYTAIQKLNKPWSFEYFDCIKDTDLTFYIKALQKQNLNGVSIPESAIKTPDNFSVHNRMKELFPGILALRYMPSLTHHVPYETYTKTILAQAATTLNIPADEEVYFFYTRFTPVIRLPFSSIGLLQEEEIMIPENLCIMPIDCSWLIFRSLEYEWTWGCNNI